MPGALQDGSEPLGVHGDRLRHEGVRLEPGQGVRLREGAAHGHQAQPQLYAAARGIPRDPAGQVSGKMTLITHGMWAPNCLGKVSSVVLGSQLGLGKWAQ